MFVGDEHVAGGVGDHEGRLGAHGYCLGGYAACPEDGDFAVFELDGFAEVGGVDVADADGGGVADVDGRAVDCGEAGCYLHGADDLLLCDRSHGDDHWVR